MVCWYNHLVLFELALVSIRVCLSYDYIWRRRTGKVTLHSVGYESVLSIQRPQFGCRGISMWSKWSANGVKILGWVCLVVLGKDLLNQKKCLLRLTRVVQLAGLLRPFP